MRRHSSVLTVLALAGALTCCGPVHAADEVDSTKATAPVSNEVEHWWGGMGAVICGLGFREAAYTISNPALLATTIGGCLLAAIDAIAD
jgi:hypothetical protein